MVKQHHPINFFIFIFFILISSILYILINSENPALFESYSLCQKMELKDSNKNNDFKVKLKNKITLKKKNYTSLKYYKYFEKSLNVNKKKSFKFYSDGIVFYNKNESIEFYDSNAEQIWTFDLSDNQLLSLSRWQNYFILQTFDKSLFIIDKNTGQPQSLIHLDNAENIPLHLVHDSIYYISKTNQNQFTLVSLNLETYKQKNIYKIQKSNDPLKLTSNKDYLIINSNSKLLVFNLNKKSLVLEYKTNSPLKVFTSINKIIYLSLKNLDLIAINLQTGEEIWKSKSKYENLNLITYIPRHKRLALYTKNNYIQIFDTIDGKSKWKLNTFNTSPYQELRAVQLNKSSKIKLDYPSKYQSWTLLASCGKNKLCLINPSSGLILKRIRFNNSPIASKSIFSKNSLQFLSYENNKYKLIKSLNTYKEAMASEKNNLEKRRMKF